MITRMSVVLEELLVGRAICAPESDGAFSYEVLIPSYLHERLGGRVGQRVTFFTIHYLEGVSNGTAFTPRLVGFPSVEDRSFFELLTTVKGVSTKKGLRAMAASPDEIAGAIASGDEAWLTKLPEIGKKLAATIVHELREKVGPFAGGSGGSVVELKGGGGSVAPVMVGPEGDAVMALVNLGESPERARALVASAVGGGGDVLTTDEILTRVYGGG